MKKYIFITLAALTVFISCHKEPGVEEEKYVEFSLTVSLDTTVVTKTSMTDDGTVGKVKWSSTDYLRLYNTHSLFINGFDSQKATNISPDGKSATFNFKVSEEYAQGLANMDNYLYYGNSASVQATAGFSSVNFSISMPANQTHAGSSCFEEFENIAFGYCPKGTFTYQQESGGYVGTTNCVMRNAFGILKVPVALSGNGDVSTIRYVRLTDKTSGQYLAGTFNVSISTSGQTAGTPLLSHKYGTGGESLTIEKTIPKGSLTSTNPYVYFLVPPGTLFGTDGLSLAVYTDAGYYGNKSVKPIAGSGMAIERSKITQLNISAFTKKEYPDPSTSFTANSYVFVDSAGVASFPAMYKGNGYQGNGGNITARQTANSIGYSSNYYPEIIWQTKCNGDVLLAAEVVDSPVYYNDDTYGPCISFHKSGVPGNALIALRDPGTKISVKQLDGSFKQVDKILWSWHVWIVEDPNTLKDGIDLYKTDGTNVFTIMDRNLGALYADPNKGTQSHGLGYQYGRKDPFMQARITNGSGEGAYASYASLYPATGIYTLETNDYDIKGSVAIPYIRLMNGNNSWCSENVEWGDPSCQFVHTKKTLYDPCPVGWRVLEEVNLIDLWGTSGDESHKSLNKPTGTVFEITPGGKAFSLKNGSDSGPRVYFPATGYAVEQDNVRGVGTNIYLWGSTSDSSLSTETVNSQGVTIMFNLKTSGTDLTSIFEISTLKTVKRATMPVRCQKWAEPGTNPAPAHAAGCAEAPELEEFEVAEAVILN